MILESNPYKFFGETNIKTIIIYTINNYTFKIRKLILIND